MDIQGATMRVAKWGNSLAVRIPVQVAEDLKLKEGDEINLLAVDYAGRAIGASRKLTKDEIILELRKFRGLRPADYKFNREEANER
jgi:antitoxin MazE